MGDQWHYNRGGKQAGPVSSDELKQLASTGQLLATDLVWKQGMPNWIPAGNITSLFSHQTGVVDGSGDVDAEKNSPARTIEKATIIEYLTFRRMITPVLIQLLFWLTVIMCILLGIYQIIDGLIPQVRVSSLLSESSRKQTNLMEVFMGFFTLAVGPIGARIYAELLILFFRMNETLSDIRQNTQRTKNP